MLPPLDRVRQAHARLRAEVDDLTDEQVAQPSSLPGWTRGHVLAHLADAARARTRVVKYALRGEGVVMWEPGERDAIIEATASRSAAEHRSAIAGTSARLEEVWASVPWPDARFVPAVFTRWREVWIHLVDLDLRVRPADWPDDFACHAVDLLHTRLPEGHAVHATDVARDWGVGTRIAAPVRDLAAWLAGREPATRPTGILPGLGPWPVY